MAIFDKFQQLAATRRAMDASGIRAISVVMDRVVSATEAVVNGRPLILAGTNNYLGLTFHPDCIAAACDATRALGTGTTGSRAANGSYSAHVQLETELAGYFQRRGVIVFSTGYVANLGMLSTLAGPGDVIVIDADCHASIYDGCRLSGAEIIRFRHNDPADLDKRLRRLGARIENTLIVVEGIYSMLGDRAPLADIAAVKRRYPGAFLVVDEAHSLGVLGAHGRGMAEEAGVEAEVDFVIGTFSKSLGAIGGYCASDHPELDLIRYANRRPSPRAAGAAVGERPSPVRPPADPRVPDEPRAEPHHRRAVRAARTGLRPLDGADGTRRVCQPRVYVNLVVPPATPDGSSLLRCSVSAGHTPDQIDLIGAAFADVQRACGAPVE